MRRALYPGTCPTCGGWIEPGDAIETDASGRWAHVACRPEERPAPRVNRRGHLTLVWDRDPLDSLFEKATRER